MGELADAGNISIHGVHMHGKTFEAVALDTAHENAACSG